MGASNTDLTLQKREPFQPYIQLRPSVNHAATREMTLPSDSASDMRLSDLLRLRMERSAFDKTPYSFLPQGALDSLITVDTILNAMGISRATHQDRDLAHYILTKAKRVFATTVYVEPAPDVLYKAMMVFQCSNFQDRDLPMEELNGTQFLGNNLNEIEHPLIKMEATVTHMSGRIWTYRRVHAFLEAQFKFLAPVIVAQEPSYDLGNRILPFVKKKAAHAEGSFGLVYQVEVHRDHIQDIAGQKNNSSRIYAIKEIKAGDRQQVAHRWESEVKALAMMNALQQDHIVRFIAAFRRGNPEALEYYMMFEWADGGNLNDLWKTIPNPTLTPTFVKAVVRQLRGLAEALSAAHHPKRDGICTGSSYRHGDLKPANILWFRDGHFGTLKIGDWGEAKSHNIVTAMRQTNTTARYGTRRYEPPECQIGFESTYFGQGRMRRSRLYDIWSFGCITLEIIIWLLYGRFGLRCLNTNMNESPFYQVEQKGGVKLAQVHHVVVSWMNHISRDAACRPGATALGDLLELVRYGLLVVKLPSKRSFYERSCAEDMYAEPGIPLLSVTPELPDQLSSLKTDTEPNIPFFNVTPADEADLIHVEVRPNCPLEVHARYRADELRNRLQLIEKNEKPEGYWSAQRELPVPDMNFISHPQSHLEIAPQSYNKYDLPNLATDMDIVVRDSAPHKQSRRTVEEDVDIDDHFNSRGRTPGSRNKRSAPPTTETTNKSTSGPSGRRQSQSKHRRIEGNGEDDEQEQDEQRRKASESAEAKTTFGCPFGKTSPGEYPKCRSRGFSRISDIKGHLRDVHRFYCARCGNCFFNQVTLDEHIRQRSICHLVDTLEDCFSYIYVKQEDNLKHAIQWDAMYEVFFPGRAKPSCYQENFERQIFRLISSKNPGVDSLDLYDALERNKQAECTHSAKAALDCSPPTTSSRGAAFETSDSGYSGPVGERSVIDPAILTPEQQHGVYEAQSVPRDIAEGILHNVASHNAAMDHQLHGGADALITNANPSLPSSAVTQDASPKWPQSRSYDDLFEDEPDISDPL